MPNRSTEIGRLTRRSPELARLRVRRAIRDARGNLWAAGRLLDLSDNSIGRYVVRFDLEPYVDMVRERFGYKIGLSPNRKREPRLL